MRRPSATVTRRSKRLTLDLDTDLHRALKIRSAELGVTMAELLRWLIERGLREPSAMQKWAKRVNGAID
jgi:hypothetical protein